MNSNEINDQKDGTNGVALPFISFDQADSQFHINEHAVAVINKIQGKIGVVSVAGLYRTGKSYLLNRILLGRSSGFGVGPTINPCTKGLWLWSEPIPGTTPNGDPISVLIVDTEGLGAFDETQNHDVRIFTLAILLSSYFIYNSMGSIDENSLNQLSLVVNLTKNIQLKQSAVSADDVDPEEFQALFPSFMWVVRDFALQLSDENNHSITPKEYLERALLEQKGFSDSVSQKNRIRRLLKSFFSDRDCCTMIRPLANESELQDLVNREVDDLRLEFQDQVKVLRRKVLGKIKPKTLKGKELSGNLLVGLAQQYVTAINQGAVPNIETAWTYICQTECQKALVEACKLFCAVIKDTIQMPCTEEELRTVFAQARKQSKKLYKQIALGKEAPELKITLRENIAVSKQRIIEQNKIESVKQMNIFLQETYTPLGHMLNQNQLESFQQFKDSLIDFQYHCEENGPQGPSSLRSQTIQEFCYRFLVVGAEQFSQSLQSEYNIQQAVNHEKIKHFEIQIQETKQNQKQERDDLELQLRQSELARADLHTLNLVSEQSLTNFRQEKIVQEELMVANHAKEKGALLKQLEACEIECQQRREALTLSQRQLLQSQSEADKQIALLNQKNDFMAQTCLAKDNVIQQLSQDFKQAQQAFNIDIKDLAQAQDKRLSEVYVSNEELNEKISELQQQNTSLEQTLISSQQSRQDAEQNLRAQIGQAKAQLKSAEEKLESLGEDSRERVQQLESQLAFLKLSADLEVAQMRGEVAEKSNARVTELEKELAIMTQKLQFAKVQNEDLNAQQADSKCAKESIMKTLQQKLQEATTGKEEALAMLEQVKEAHSADLKELTRNFDASRLKDEEKLEKLMEERTNIQLNSKLELANLKKELNLVLSALNQAEELRQEAVNQLRQSDLKQTNILEQEKIHSQEIIQGLEDQLEKAQADAETETKLLQEQAEQSLAQLKSLYDLERLRLETRLNEEKERSLKKFVQVQQEYETRIRDEQNQREEDIEMLQQEMRDIEHRHQQTIKHLEHENCLMTQKIQSLEDHMKDQEVRMIRDQQMNQKQLEFAADKAQQERKDMQTKIEEAQKCGTMADQKLLSVKTQYQHLKNEATKHQDRVIELKQNFEAERQTLIQKFEDLRLRNQQISDENLQQRLEEGREIALHKQRVEFQERKIDELSKQLESTVSLYEDRIRVLKFEMQSDFQEQLQRLYLSKEQSESKFDAKRKALKEKEAVLQKQVLESEKECAILDQQLTSSQLHGQETIQKLQAENQQQREQLQQMSESLFEIRDSLTSEIEQLKSQLSDLEREHQEQQNNSERDKALMEGKVQFLEQQRDQAKIDYLEASQKFETTLDQIKKRGFFEQDRSESNSSALVSQLEMKIKRQVQDWGEEKKKMVNEHENAISKLVSQKFQLDADLQLLERDRQLLIKQQTKKLEELSLKESELMSELQSLRNERELNSSQVYKQHERERESQKQKIKDVEMRANEAEIKRNALMFDFEKERARWSQEKDQMKNRLREHVEQIESLERAKETIIKECEKLKNQQRKTSMMQTQRVMSNSKSGRYETLTPSSMGLESFKNSIFVGGPSKGFIGGRESNLGSQTGSQNDLETPIMTLPFSKRDDNLLSLRVQREATPEKPSLFATKSAAKKENTSIFTTKAAFKEENLPIATPKAVIKDENKSMFTTKISDKEEKSENMIATKAPGKVINFNMTRTKERLSNISNLLYKKPELD